MAIRTASTERAAGRRFALGVAIALYALAAGALAGPAEVSVGAAAPEFTLPDQDGRARALAEFRGRWVVLYFYPKDDTPGCTTEACQFRDDFVSLQKLGAEVVGVSVDARASHAAFAKKFSLPFPLLSDTDGAVAARYGSLWGVWPLRFAQRHTFIIDPQGRIARIYREVDPATHSREVIGDLTARQQAGSK